MTRRAHAIMSFLGGSSIISYYDVVLSNIEENNFTTDCVALFWCHSTVAIRVLRGMVLIGHGQKTLKKHKLTLDISHP